MKGFDIIILAGQSNAEGSGTGRVYKKFSPDGKIFELVDANREKVVLSEQGWLSLIKPYEYVVQEAREIVKENKPYGNLAHGFAEEYIRAGKLEEDRCLLIVKAAIGGTGFARKHWGKDDELPKRMYDMIDYALGLEGDNRIVAFLWHQGEHDSVENSEFSLELRGKYYFEKFNCLISETLKRYGQMPVIAAGFTEEWSKDYVKECAAVIKAMKKVLALCGGGFVTTRGLKSNNEDSGNGDTIHFCRSALYKLGKRYFNKFIDITKVK